MEKFKEVLFTEAYHKMQAYKKEATVTRKAAYVTLIGVIVKAGLTAEWLEYRQKKYRQRMEEDE